MGFNPKERFEHEVQQHVDDMRICQTKRDELIKELDLKKDDIKSIEEWIKILWL